MRKFIFTFVFCAALVGLFSATSERMVNGQTKQDNIRYNVVYECEKSTRKFRILSCDREMCKTFQINEYNPNGGSELELTRKEVLYNISTYKCSAPDGINNEPQNEEKPDKEPTQNEKPTAKNNDKAVACPVSDADSKGKTALEKSFRGAIRETWEVEPQEGLDGRVTITFQAFSVGAARKYRTYIDPSDAVGKMIYPVRATFTTCTDYNRRIENVKREREFSCYKNTAGKYSCTIIAAPNTNVKDKTESIDKPK